LQRLALLTHYKTFNLVQNFRFAWFLFDLFGVAVLFGGGGDS